MTLRLFVSFQYETKARAVWLHTQLSKSGYQVLIEDDFGAGSPRTEMSLAIVGSDIVIALISPGFVTSRATRRELDIAEAHGKEIVAVFAGTSARHAEAQPFGHYRRIELDENWKGSDEQWNRILVLLNRVLSTERRRRESGGLSARMEKSEALVVGEAILLFDLEDQQIAWEVLRSRPGWRRATDPIRAADDRHTPRVLLWTRASAEPYSLVHRQYERVPRDVRTFLITTADAPPPPAGSVAVPLSGLLAGVLGDEEPATPSGASPRDQVLALIDEVRKQNDNTPIDVLVERFCRSAELDELTTTAHDLAVQTVSVGDPVRLRAVYDHALALRFFGRWRAAVGVLENEMTATPEDGLSIEARSLLERLRLEKLTLEYELGLKKAESAVQSAKEIQTGFHQLNDLDGYVQAGRVRGNVFREMGDFDRAVQVLQRTIGVAEYLAEHSGRGGPGKLMLADCHRELATLHTARRDVKQARISLEEARELLSAERVETSAPVLYLSAVLEYVSALIADREEASPAGMAPMARAQLALATLAMFENPIRLASIYDWLGRAWTRQVPGDQDDLERAEEYLRKALRIRESLEHSYPVGLSHLSLGELYNKLGKPDESIRHFEDARKIFNQRGLRPALARAHASLARAYFRRSGGEPGDDFDQYRSHLGEAESGYEQLHLQNEGLELRYELEHSGRKPMTDVLDDTPLIAVGEYLLHGWIREHTQAENPPLDDKFEVLVGVGDDGAVVACSGVEPRFALVFSTDSAPGSLATPGRSPEYLGRFSVVHSLADIYAMGAKPMGMLLNVFLSRAATVGYTRRVIESVVREARRYGVPVLGGDMKERNEQSVGCVAIGYVETGQILTRSAARPGHAVCITLASADSGGGHRRIGARWAQELAEQYRMTTPSVLAAFPNLAQIIDPALKYDLLYLPDKVMTSISATGLLRSAIDTSDGVLACLEILGRSSGVGFELDERAIDSIIDERARVLAGILGIAPATFLFNAGHDWEIVFTCEEGDLDRVTERVSEDLKGNGTVAKIGTVVARREQDEQGVLMRRSDGTTRFLQYYTDEKFVPRHYQDRPAQWLQFAQRLPALAAGRLT